ncbi:ClpXP protease specificity-enhancing factor [Halomonas sp. TRM85114]|uniref:ClpXP protease specificity-enhancing factor n=1 Tax=Halomonas jincaotanensis TaxID=2810616 RepID=UPI001BD64697|nr:ClpXP protease specificity-enhancing factor [Halomonas jincaotanensis]MBS9402082.1 ClpXP protease specificity-enhancing factor [Halomonas jincaotanensis]
MQSSRPYLVRALNQWLLDNALTPYIVVDAEYPGVEVPRQFVQNGQIVLNMAPTAVRDIFMENEALGFSARFGGQPMRIMVPMAALVAIYARENGVGMVFGHEPELPIADGEKTAPADEQAPTLSSVEIDDSGEDGTSDKDGGKADEDEAPRKGKPSLRVIK